MEAPSRTSAVARVAGAAFYGVGVLVLFAAHAGALHRLRYGGGSYLPRGARELGFAGAGLVALGAGLALAWRGRAVRPAGRAAGRAGGRTGGTSAGAARVVGAAGLVSLAACAVLLAGMLAAFCGSPGFALPLRLAGGLFLAGQLAALALLARPLLRLARGRREARAPSARLAFALALLVPANVLAMAHGCGYPGCTETCERLTYGGAGLGALALLAASGGASVAPALALLPLWLWPHCVCDNPINGPWMERLGASPACFAFAVTGGLFALAGLAGIAPRTSAALAAVPALGAAAFAFGHHVLRFPW